MSGRLSWVIKVGSTLSYESFKSENLPQLCSERSCYDGWRRIREIQIGDIEDEGRGPQAKEWSSLLKAKKAGDRFSLRIPRKNPGRPSSAFFPSETHGRLLTYTNKDNKLALF